MRIGIFRRTIMSPVLFAVVACCASQLACSRATDETAFIRRFNEVQDLITSRKYEKALPLAKKLEQRAYEDLGESHLWTAETTMSLAMIYTELKSLDSAESSYRRAIRLFAMHPAEGDTGLFLCYLRLGGILDMSLDRSSEAESVLQNAQRMLASGFETDLFHQGLLQFYLAKSYMGQGRPRDGLNSFDRALSFMLRELDKGNPALLPVLEGYADSAEKTGLIAKRDSLEVWIHSIRERGN